jgi:hypothetical protein
MQKVYCENCEFAKYERKMNKFGSICENSWGSYCSRNGDHYNKYIFDLFTGEFKGEKQKTPRSSNNKGNCKFYKRKWWKFFVK